MKTILLRSTLNLVLAGITVGISGCSVLRIGSADDASRQWLAGDHHIHSEYSVGWDRTQNPPTPIKGGDAIYPIARNAEMAASFGLSWMVATDHGGPNHSKINHDQAYPDLLESRKQVGSVIQFFGMELDTPAGEHSSLIIPHTHDEAEVLQFLESGFAKFEVFPVDSTRDTEHRMIEALRAMDDLGTKPLIIANHPARTVSAEGVYGAYHPSEFRNWNDAAPEVAVGMAGAPGHQAITLSTNPGITTDAQRVRGGYGGFPTMGGYDKFTAELGGLWDSMLGEGRHWWITSNSDSHVHFSEGGIDFWPGEYSKTYVYAEKNHDSIMQGIRSGNVFVTTGDLISELFVEVSSGSIKASIGGEISVSDQSNVTISVTFRDPDGLNHGGQNPAVNRVDLIVGNVFGPADDRSLDRNESTRVAHRFDASEWSRDGEWVTMKYTLTVDSDSYIRVRGTNTSALEPEKDPANEDPWSDLWFYSNPVFISTR